MYQSDKYVQCDLYLIWTGQKMFPSDEFWKGAMFGTVIGGVITVVLLKLWEKKEAPLGTSGAGKSDKQPTEHDERY